MKMIHRGEKGFTLIELLVVIAILGVIAAVVALNVAGFFGRGTLQAANTELHQVQTAIISAMADCTQPGVTASNNWSGEGGVVHSTGTCYNGTPKTPGDAAFYCYGPFKAQYTVTTEGKIEYGVCNYTGGWGGSIVWDEAFDNWKQA
jgi:prepilin-type N-terminal cleavage/methylation domain-containing protein